jgi:S-formylglutathione hydrolase FrmB
MKLLLPVLFSVLTVSCSTAQKTDQLRLYSSSMKKYVNTIVITPASYKQSNQRFPVVYLLHGYAGGEKDWITKVPKIRSLANSSNCIIVCADAKNSWYFNSPAIADYQYETFMGKELVKAIDSAYKTYPDAKHRAITGLSMGGHGALMLALKNKSVFGAAGSMSGGLDIRGFMGQFELNKVIGDTSAINFYWKNYSVLQMTDSNSFRGVQLIIDCGVDDFFIETNRALHQKLLQYRIPHDYIERPGNHSWTYWATSVEYQFFFFRKFFNE